MPLRNLLPLLFLLPVLAHAAAPKDDADPDQSSCDIGLALGSGGAAGLAHISILQVFDELDLRPSRIVGTSIGAVIGALYAAGMDAQTIRSLFEEFGGSGLDALSGLFDGGNGLDLRDVLDLDLANGGLIDPTGFIDFLAERTEARSFSDLRLPLEVIATDYWSGRTVTIDSGNLFEAVQASMAVPGLFSPVPRGDQLLIDGGTSNPLPFDLLLDDCERVIAVDVSGARPRRGEAGEADLTDLLFGSFELMQQSMIAEKRRHRPPHLYLKPEIRNVRLLHFNRIDRVLSQAGPAADRLRLYLSAPQAEPEARP